MKPPRRRQTRPKPNVKFGMNPASWAWIGLAFVLIVLALLIAGFFASSSSVSPVDLL